jgi:hypothetical protein
MNFVNSILSDKKEMYKFKNFINIQYGGQTVFPINPSAYNIDPYNNTNCGPLALFGLDILDEHWTKEVSDRCKPNPKGYLKDGGMPANILIEYIKKSGKLTTGSELKTRCFLEKYFFNYWNNYAQNILDTNGQNGIIFYCGLVNNILNYDWGHFIILVNINDDPYIIDLQKSIYPKPISTLDTIGKILYYMTIEDVHDKNYIEDIPGVNSTVMNASPILMARQPSEKHYEELFEHLRQEKLEQERLEKKKLKEQNRINRERKLSDQEENELLDKLIEEERKERERLNQAGGGIDKINLYKLKYLKYKIKYLKLKNLAR